MPAPWTDELATLAEALALASAASRPALVRIEGPWDAGKTALLEAFVASVRERTNLVHARAQRLERLLPQALGSPLQASTTVLAIDDAQWLDDASLALLDRRLRDSGELRLIVLAHDGEAPPMRAVAERVIILPLPRDESLSYQHTAREIARFLSALPPSARTMAQILALIAAPVDPRLQQALWSDRRELDDAIALLAPLLNPDRSSLAFARTSTAAAIVETIPMKIPLHRRIIAAIERAGIASLKDRILLVEQYLGSGDRQRAQDAALDLAFAAERANAPQAQLWASARHVELGEPARERFVAFYAQYFRALMNAREFERAERVASHALSDAQRHGLDGVVTLAAHLIEAQWAVERHDAARASYERYALAFTDPLQLAELRAAAPWLRAP